MRLKNRNHDTPAGWNFSQPSITPKPITAHSFETLVREVVKIRRANPGITKRDNLSTDTTIVGQEVEAQIVAKLLAMGNANHFLSEDSATPLPKPWNPQRLRQSADAAVEKVKRVMAGAGIYISWLGSGGLPVAQDKANERAAVCASCKYNEDRGDLMDYFIAPVAAALKETIAIKNDMKLTTPHDAQLHLCTICDCPMKTKVWTPISHIKKEMSPKTMGALPEWCWVKKEST